MALESRADNAARVAQARLPDRVGLVLIKSMMSEDELSSPRKELELPSEESSSSTKSSPEKARRSCGVNLGGFYGPAAVQESPRFIQQPERLSKVSVGPQLHVALVKIRAPACSKIVGA